MSNTVYKTIFEDIEVGCREHGAFSISAACFKTGQGCIKCSGWERWTTELFKEEMIKIYENRFNLSKVEITNGAYTEVNLLCSKHGEFTRNVIDLMRNRHCKYCSSKRPWNLQRFLEDAQEKHGDKYDYSLIEEINSKDDIVLIKCKKHGIFKQMCCVHTYGCGCSDCSFPGYNEMAIKVILQGEDIDFVHQQYLKKLDPTLKRQFRFDFYFPTINLVIEYNGKQHYQVSNFTSNKKEAERLFKIQQSSDQFKRDFCKNKSIELYEIDGREYTGPSMIDHLKGDIIPYIKQQIEKKKIKNEKD